MNIAPIIAGKQNQILRRFREAGATDAERARSASDLGCRKSLVFQGLVARGILVATSDGRYYLEAQAAEAFVANRRKALIAAVLVTLVIVVVFLLTR